MPWPILKIRKSKVCDELKRQQCWPFRIVRIHYICKHYMAVWMFNVYLGVLSACPLRPLHTHILLYDYYKVTTITETETKHTHSHICLSIFRIRWVNPQERQRAKGSSRWTNSISDKGRRGIFTRRKAKREGAKRTGGEMEAGVAGTRKEVDGHHDNIHDNDFRCNKTIHAITTTVECNPPATTATVTTAATSELPLSAMATSST